MKAELSSIRQDKETRFDAPPGVCDTHAAEAVELPDTDYAGVVRRGMLILAFGFGGLLLWAMAAPLDEGIPAQGVVAVESNRKRINHLTGGLVDRILVREGQAVKAGDELLALNETQARSVYKATLGQWQAAAATLARLQAERNAARTIAFPPELTEAAAGDPEVAALLRTQERLFRMRTSALEGDLRIIHESVRGLETQVATLAKLRDGREKQIALFNEQLASFQRLRSDGFVARNYLLDIEKQLAEVQSKQSEDLSSIAGIHARLAEFRMRGTQRRLEYQREVETQLTEVQRDLALVGERIHAQRDDVERLVVRAPATGTVVDLAVHTEGGVIKPGERILDIVPQADALIVEAQVAPQHIDRLHAGLAADVHFDAYSSRVEQPSITGRVDSVSADALSDQRTGTLYYKLRVSVPASEAAKLGAMQLQPGMQATVMVKTGERSLIVYLLRPLLRRFKTALVEY